MDYFEVRISNGGTRADGSPSVTPAFRTATADVAGLAVIMRKASSLTDGRPGRTAYVIYIRRFPATPPRLLTLEICQFRSGKVSSLPASGSQAATFVTELTGMSVYAATQPQTLSS